ncbi:MAG: hypothetical protein NVV59_12440 [Chitinophagaceae bacterium]|nr:hypothetical protein [Chitinophagaceae bacterium]
MKITDFTIRNAIRRIEKEGDLFKPVLKKGINISRILKQLSNKKEKIMKAIWSGAIAFGLVNIPVKLYSAVKESRLDFDMLDKKDHSRIKYKRVNESTGKRSYME